MSNHAYRIECARRLYVAAIGSAHEESMRRSLEQEIADARPKPEPRPDWCCASGCQGCPHGAQP